MFVFTLLFLFIIRLKFPSHKSIRSVRKYPVLRIRDGASWGHDRGDFNGNVMRISWDIFSPVSEGVLTGISGAILTGTSRGYVYEDFSGAFMEISWATLWVFHGIRYGDFMGYVIGISLITLWAFQRQRYGDFIWHVMEIS